MATITRYLPLLLCVLLVGCANDNDDLRTWMAQQENSMQGRVTPIPEMKPHTVIEYEVADYYPDPFNPVRVIPPKGDTSGVGPDRDRVPEPLEAFPLTSLSMVGMLRQDDSIKALIKAGSSLYQVGIGNYLGQDYGKVIEIDDTQLTLEEWVESSEGEWIQRTNTLILQER